MHHIVLDQTLGLPMQLLRKSTAIWPDVPPGGILRRGLDGGYTTSFPSRKAAMAAIKRTQRYDILMRRKPDLPRIGMKLNPSRLIHARADLTL